jgi:pimeloyl-ACP methyl ester carboxylesterase
MTATVVLVHGAWHGAWCWDKVTPLLDAAAVPWIAIDLPGHGASTEPLTDLEGDAAALRSAVADLDDAVVCGHSYGGAVISVGAADVPAVRHLVYIAAFPLAPGESCMNAAADEVARGAGTTELGSVLTFGDDGLVTLDAGRAAPLFFHDCTPADIAWATERLGPQAVAELAGVAGVAAWQTVPSTYVVCTDDRAVAPALQHAMAARCTRTIEWPTGHSPFLSRPELVADLVAGLARDGAD